MRLIDADELIEHAWRDKLDSRELIAEMIEKAPTIKEIPTNIPIDVFEQLLSMHVNTGHWIDEVTLIGAKICRCSECNFIIPKPRIKNNFCPDCGAKMIDPQESEG